MVRMRWALRHGLYSFVVLVFLLGRFGEFGHQIVLVEAVVAATFCVFAAAKLMYF